MQRYGSVIELKADSIEEYKKLHAAVWPEILENLKEVNIQNYSIYLAPIKQTYYLFSYFEYIGEDFDGDMQKMADAEITKKWWDLCMPCQKPLDNRAENEWWMNIEEVFHMD